MRVLRCYSHGTLHRLHNLVKAVGLVASGARLHDLYVKRTAFGSSRWEVHARTCQGQGMLVMAMAGSQDELGSSNEAKIKVIGVGGSDSNAENRMLESEMQGVEFSIVNIDAHALSNTVYSMYL